MRTPARSRPAPLPSRGRRLRSAPPGSVRGVPPPPLPAPCRPSPPCPGAAEGTRDGERRAPDSLREFREPPLGAVSGQCLLPPGVAGARRCSAGTEPGGLRGWAGAGGSLCRPSGSSVAAEVYRAAGHARVVNEIIPPGLWEHGLSGGCFRQRFVSARQAAVSLSRGGCAMFLRCSVTVVPQC